MKHKNWVVAGALIAAVAIVSGQSLQAALTPNEIYNQFGSRSFTAANSNGSTSYEVGFNISGVDNSAYAPSVRYGANGFVSICAEIYAGVEYSGTARLSYNELTGVTKNDAGQSLSLGGALLYKMYATGEFDSSTFNYSNSSQRQYDAAGLWHVMNHLSFGSDLYGAGYMDYKFIDVLNAINPNMDYWKQTYNVNQRYDEIGDYAVFIMNLTGQDRYYIANAYYETVTPPDPNDVPEPATLLLWTLGGLGVTGSSWMRKRNKKNLKLA
jgi:hypothetical protein